jgi:ATP-dependent protease HslVU (ClpYQ) ATPase subunit
VYDDTDFYQQLLKELIETTTDTDKIHVTQYWSENQSLKRKMKKAVERSVSKGRKVKYEVHDKLVGFMAPKNDTTLESSAWRPQELYANMFGGQNKDRSLYVFVLLKIFTKCALRLPSSKRTLLPILFNYLPIIK